MAVARAGGSTEKRLARSHRSDEEYGSFLLLWAYVSYPPTYISGPVGTL